MQKGVLLSLVVSGIIIIQTVPIFAEETATVGETFYLGQVLVTAKKGDVDLATTVSVVSSEDIERQGAQNVAEALDRVPGIDVRMGNKGNASLKLRGFDQENVKVLIDGVPAHETYYGSLDLDQIPVDAIAKIEVTKGASSVLYGSNTMGGVINIITKKGGEKPVTSFVTSFGENNTHNFSVNHGASVDKFNYWLTYSYRGTDGFELSDDFDKNNDRTGLGTGFNEDGGLRDLSDFTKRTLNAKVGYEYDADSKLYLSFDYHNNEKGCPTGKLKKKDQKRYWTFTEWDQWHLNLAGEHDLTDLLTMKARLFYVKHDDTLKDVSWDDDHTTNSKWFEECSYDDYSIGGELQSYIDFGQWSLLKIGVNYLKDNHKQQDLLDVESLAVKKFGASPGLAPEEEFESETYSFAMEDEIMVLDNLSFIVGFSYDVNEPEKANDQPVPDKMDTFNPQVGVVYDATNTLSLHASVGKKTRFPQLIELYSNAAGGNPNLDPQQTVAYELGASKKINDFLKASMAIFYNDIEDRIMKPEDAYVNMGESTIYGAEFDTCYTRFGLDVGLNYTYLNAKEKKDSNSKERDAENTPEHKVNMDVSYTFAFGLSTCLQASYTADQIEYDYDDNKVDLDDFIVINCKVSQDLSSFINIDSTVFMEVKNIMDKDYEESNGPMPGRSFLAGITARF